MGSIGVTLTVSGDGDRAALHSAVWKAAYNLIDTYTASPEYEPNRRLLADSIKNAPVGKYPWGVDGDRLSWYFYDFGACRLNFSQAWVHWLHLAFAADWDGFVRLAKDNGLEITSIQGRSEPPVLAEEVAIHSFVTLHGKLWLAWETPWEKGLVWDDGDDDDDYECIPIAELTSEERALYDKALKRCLCGPCTMLYPPAQASAAQ